MKKILILALAFSMVSSLAAQEQWSLVSKRTAHWCSNCGGWGWTAFKDLVDGLQDENAIVVALHTSSSDLTNDASIDLLANLGGSGQPKFYLNTDDYTNDMGNIIGDVQLANSLGGVITAEMDVTEEMDGTLTVDAFVEAFESLNGEYRLGLYLIQDHVIASQSGQGANADHRNLLTASFFENSLGELIGEGSMVAGDVFQFNANIPLPTNYEKENTKVAAMIWRPLNNGQYFFINGNLTDEITVATTSTNDLDDVFSNLTIFQKANNTIEVRFDALSTLDNIQLNVLNQQGLNIKSISTSAIEGYNQYQLELDQLNNGIYILNIQSHNESISKQFVVIK